MFGGVPDTGPCRRADEVARQGLCLRCGACAGLCPHKAISFNARGMPVVSEDHCTECGLCARVCPGWELPLRADAQERYGVDEEASPVGPVHKCCICRSTDPDVHLEGTSGGFVTQALIYLLRAGKIDGALVSSSVDGQLLPRAHIARTEDEIRAGAGSKYCLFPWGTALREIAQTEGTYALVGLPCHVHAFRRASRAMPRLARRTPWVFGLFCSMNMKPWVVRDVLHARGLSTHRVSWIEYRAGEWPGRILARMTDGRSVDIFPKEVNENCQAISHLKWTHGQWRCLLCPDRPALLADFAACDPWIRDTHGSFVYAGTGGETVVVCRTAQAAELLHNMNDDGAIVCREGDIESLLPLEAPRSVMKKRDALERVARLKGRKRAHPRYDLPLPEPHVAGPAEVAAAILLRILHVRALGMTYLVFITSPLGRALSWLNSRRKRITWRWKHSNSMAGGETA